MAYQVHEHPVVKYFLMFTKYTCPFGWEEVMYGDFFRQRGAYQDTFGNFFIQVGDNTDILFASHLDTASKEEEPIKVRRQWAKNNILRTDGKTILGADDKAGVAIMLYMIDHEVPGTYAFFLGEERGCRGSGAFATAYTDSYKQMVSFDRLGYESIITHQMGERCCSDTYANELASYYAAEGIHTLQPDPSGTYTDSAEFTHLIPECTNISVGYLWQHTTSEEQDASFLVNMAEASVKIPWNLLPIERDPYTYEYRYGDGYFDPINSEWIFPSNSMSRRTSSTYHYAPTSATDVLSFNMYYSIGELEQFCAEHPDEAADVIDALLQFRRDYFELGGDAS